MEIVFLLVGISVLLVTVIVSIFIWAVNHQQFDDLEGPGYRILGDEDSPDPEKDR